MQTTPILGLKKPENNEYVNVADLNDNSDVVDEAVSARVESSGGDISETVIETLDTVEDKYPVPAAGESVKRFFGKVLTFLRNIRPLTGDITLYVSANTGSDITGDGTSGNPFKTIQHAIDLIPKNMNGYTATMIIGDGTYDEAVRIVGFDTGNLTIKSNNPNTLNTLCTIKQVGIYSNSSAIHFYGLCFTDVENEALYSYWSTLYIGYCQIVESAPTKYGFRFLISDVRMVGCRSMNRESCVQCYNTYLYSADWSADSFGYNYGIRSEVGSRVHKQGNQPTGNIKSEIGISGGMFINQNGTQISALITSGLSCTWGIIHGGFYRNGNSNGNGVAEVIVQLDIYVTTALSAGSIYEVVGLPLPSSGYNVPVAINRPAYVDHCYLAGADGKIRFIPLQTMPINNGILLNCTYVTNL